MLPNADGLMLVSQMPIGPGSKVEAFNCAKSASKMILITATWRPVSVSATHLGNLK